MSIAERDLGSLGSREPVHITPLREERQSAVIIQFPRQSPSLLEHARDEEPFFPQNVRAELAITETDITAAEALEYDIFTESGYNEGSLGLNLQEQGGRDGHRSLAAYKPYRDVSRFYIVKDENSEEIVGMMRVIGTNPIGFPTVNDFFGESGEEEKKKELAEKVSSLGHVEDVATAAVRKEYRVAHHGVYPMSLYRAAFQDAIADGVENWIFTTDSRVTRNYRIAMRFQLESLGEQKEYMGTPTDPCALDLLKQLAFYNTSDNPRFREIGRYLSTPPDEYK
jgi:hypothetical protein